MINQNLREKLYKIMEVYSESTTQYAVAKEILLKLNNNEKLNSTEIAEKSFTSKPTVIRFAQSLGFLGFKEFHKELLVQEKRYLFELPAKEMNQSFLDYSDSLRKYIDEINSKKDLLTRIAKLIQKQQAVIIFSSPENTFLANVFSEKLRLLGFNVCSSSKSQNFLLLNQVKKDDLIIFLVSGYDNDMLVKIWDMLDTDITKCLFGTTSQTVKFKDPEYLISIDLGQNILREQVKPFLFSYILDQLNNLLIYSEERFLNTFTNLQLKL